MAPFSSTLLVHDEHLVAARRAAESRTLGVRLVIEAVPHSVDEPRRPKDARSLVHRLTVSDGPFASYVRRRIATEFDYACVSHPDELDDVERGVTIGGLVKLLGVHAFSRIDVLGHEGLDLGLQRLCAFG